MSVQSNQYLMYGTILPYSFCMEWEKENPGKEFYDTFDDYTDSAYTNKAGKDGIICLMDGMDSSYIIIGICFNKSMNHESISGPMMISNPLTRIDMENYKNKVKYIFGQKSIEGEFGMILVTHYR